MKRTLSRAAVSASIGLLAVAALAGPALTATTVVVSDANSDGWTARHAYCGEGTSSGSQTMENGPATPPTGAGSREFRIGTDGNSFEEYRQDGYDGTRLADLTSFRYSTYVEQSSGGKQAPYLILNIDRDGDGDTDEFLFFEPIYQREQYGNPDQGEVVLNTWQTWDALAGRWDVVDPGEGPEPGNTTLAAYAAVNPNAVVSTEGDFGGLRLATGCGDVSWTNFVGNVDTVVIGSNGNETVFDFELFGPPTCRPGNGYGDRNRCHSGPPGQTSERPGQGGGR